MAEVDPFRPVDRVERSGRTVGSRQLALLLPDPAGARPAYRHLAQAVSRLILDGRIALHVKLPAERELAVALKTSRATVTAMYDLLRESGYARSRQGSGTWTALPEGGTPSGLARALGPPDATIDLARAAPGLEERRARRRPRPGRAAGWPSTRTPPAISPIGLPALRAAIADRFTRRGLATVPEQILVTSGAQHALTLVLGLLCGPGDRVMAENPSYPNALEAMRRARLRTVSVPVTETGWDIEIVESTLRQVVPQLAYLIPDFHNPTGCLMPGHERARVLRAAQRSGTWLVVDETMAELALDVPAPAPFASFAAGAAGGTGQVITIGSMSKTHWGGLRIGWLRAPSQLVTELAGQRVASDMGGSVLDQLVALDLLSRRGRDTAVPPGGPAGAACRARRRPGRALAALELANCRPAACRCGSTWASPSPRRWPSGRMDYGVRDRGRRLLRAPTPASSSSGCGSRTRRIPTPCARRYAVWPPPSPTASPPRPPSGGRTGSPELRLSEQRPHRRRTAALRRPG